MLNYLSLVCFCCSLFLAGCSDPTPLQQLNAPVQLSTDFLLDAKLTENGKQTVLLTEHDIQVIDNFEHKLLQQWPLPSGIQARHLALSSYPLRIVAATEKQVFLFDFETRQQLLSQNIKGFSEHAKIDVVQLNPQGNKILLGLNEGSIVELNLLTNRQSRFKLHDSNVRHLFYTGNENMVLSAGNDGQILYWQISSGAIKNSRKLDSRISSLTLSGDQSKFFVSDVLTSQMVIKLDDFSETQSLDYLQRFRQFRQAHFIKNDTLITTDSKAGIGKWRLSTETKIASAFIMAMHFGSTTFDLTSNGGKLVTISSDGFLQHWQIK